MSYLVIFLYFFGLLAHGSYAGFSEEKLDPSLLPKVYEKGGRSFLPPRLERKVSTCNLQHDFLNITKTYGGMVAVNLYAQAEKRGRELILDLKNATEHLQGVMKSGGKSPDRKDMESAMTVLTNVLERFLKLKPGHTSVKTPELPRIPKRSVDTLPTADERSAEDLFVQFPQVVYSDFISSFASLQSMFLEGWHATMPYSYIVQAQFREQILNREVTYAYKQYVSAIYEQCIPVQKLVKSGIWKNFHEAAGDILGIADSYSAAMECKSERLKDEDILSYNPAGKMNVSPKLIGNY